MSNTPNLRHARKQLLAISSLRNRGRRGVMNDCQKPGLGASKEDLLEFHKERVRNRMGRRRRQQPNSGHAPSTSIAAGNRHGGPHKHQREIDRRRRQAAPG